MDASERDFRLKKYEDGSLPDIWFSDVLPFFLAGKSDRKIYAQFPDLAESKLARARAYYHAKVSPKKNDRPLRILCDENVSNAHLRSCQNAFNYATSIGVEKMNGMTDHDVWAFAKAGGFDVIVTHDQRNCEMRDLTRIAVCAWHDAIRGGYAEDVRLPVLLHLTGAARDAKSFRRILFTNLDRIFDVCGDGRMPVLRMNEAGVHTEIAREDIESVLFKPSGQPQDLTRQEQWARYFLRKVLPQHAWQEREDPRVLDIKRRITLAVAIANRYSRQQRVSRTPEFA